VPTPGQTLYKCTGDGELIAARFIGEHRQVMPWGKYETVWLVETSSGVMTLPITNPYRETPEEALVDYIDQQTKAAEQHAATARFYAGLAANAQENAIRATLQLVLQMYLQPRGASTDTTTESR
jgi:hypothetical protein